MRYLYARTRNALGKIAEYGNARRDPFAWVWGIFRSGVRVTCSETRRMNRPNLNLQAAFSICALAFAFALAACDQITNQPKAETTRGWDIPTDPQEKAAYDYAHSLKLPDSVPKPAPFDFAKAKLTALKPGNPSVSDQYFEHLCKTEAGECIFKTVENVEGVFQMRPRPKTDDTDLDFDRYRLEEPTGIGWSGDNNNYNNDESALDFIQPMAGKYRFLEQPKRGETGKIFRLVRKQNDNPPDRYSNGYPTGIGGSYFRVPWMSVMVEDTQRLARYGFTWRGIKRDQDREFAIASGEYIILDVQTNEVLAVWRQFKKSGQSKRHQSGIAWSNAKSCPMKAWTHTQFVMSVLHWQQGINNEFIPEYLNKHREGK
jgi:hypothetical protein